MATNASVYFIPFEFSSPWLHQHLHSHSLFHLQNLSTISSFPLAPISTLLRPLLVTWFKQRIQINYLCSACKFKLSFKLYILFLFPFSLCSNFALSHTTPQSQFETQHCFLDLQFSYWTHPFSLVCGHSVTLEVYNSQHCARVWHWTLHVYCLCTGPQTHFTC